MSDIEFVRNRILNILYARRPHGVRDEEILLEMQREVCPVTVNELAGEIVYLRDKGLLHLEEVRRRGRTIYVSSITALGRDVLEGNAPPVAGVAVI